MVAGELVVGVLVVGGWLVGGGQWGQREVIVSGEAMRVRSEGVRV